MQVNMKNTVCKDDIINEWNVRVNEIKHDVSVMTEINDQCDGQKNVNNFSVYDIYMNCQYCLFS